MKDIQEAQDYLDSVRAHDSTSSANLPQSRVGPFGLSTQPTKRNLATGMGTSRDKGIGVDFIPLILNEYTADVLYNMCWAAQKMIDIPVDDMFFRGRQWTSENETDAEKMDDAEKILKPTNKLRRAMKAGRLYGTSFLIIYPKDDEIDMTKPLDMKFLEKDWLSNLRVVNRWHCTVRNWQSMTRRRGYGTPVSVQNHQSRLRHACSRRRGTRHASLRRCADNRRNYSSFMDASFRWNRTTARRRMASRSMAERVGQFCFNQSVD